MSRRTRLKVAQLRALQGERELECSFVVCNELCPCDVRDAKEEEADEEGEQAHDWRNSVARSQAIRSAERAVHGT